MRALTAVSLSGIPEGAFKEVASEAIELTDAKNVDVDPNRG